MLADPLQMKHRSQHCACTCTAAALQGETLGNLRHGRGIHTCSNGDIYDGQWAYDKRHGTGKFVAARGICYEGEWKEDRAHGWVGLRGRTRMHAWAHAVKGGIEARHTWAANMSCLQSSAYRHVQSPSAY